MCIGNRENGKPLHSSIFVVRFLHTALLPCITPCFLDTSFIATNRCPSRLFCMFNVLYNIEYSSWYIIHNRHLWILARYKYLHIWIFVVHVIWHLVSKWCLRSANSAMTMFTVIVIHTWQICLQEGIFFLTTDFIFSLCIGNLRTRSKLFLERSSPNFYIYLVAFLVMLTDLST